MSVNNIYSLANAELERLHQLVVEMSRQHERHQHQQPMGYAGISSGAGMSSYPQYASSDLTMIYHKIERFHEYLFKALETSDEKIQEKVAELALTDVQKEIK